MNTVEFDIIDELYFVTGFAALSERLGLPEKEVEAGLMQLIRQGYVKSFFPDPDTEITPTSESFEINFRKCYFLATKAGLIAHNSK